MKTYFINKILILNIVCISLNLLSQSKKISEVFTEIKKYDNVDLVKKFNGIDTTYFDYCTKFNFIKWRCDSITNDKKYKVYFNTNKQIEMVGTLEYPNPYYMKIFSISDSIIIFNSFFLQNKKDEDMGLYYIELSIKDGLYVNYQNKKLLYIEPPLTMMSGLNSFFEFSDYEWYLKPNKSYKIRLNIENLDLKNIKYYYYLDENLKEQARLFSNYSSIEFLMGSNENYKEKSSYKTHVMEPYIKLKNNNKFELSSDYRDKDFTLKELIVLFECYNVK